ncbi:TonB-dependent receptor [Spongiivirga citrea]|uniref:TonB-dependent receptor plug domain-containing protein n=1 Tax=Spongiivirga citrea TaxID=1481457 RepID=A0A6M0CCZ3_9FLAO|nr:carboxypeptidase-like regulatory domain-containing protein [Spongiivirga citrea]NER15708.1 TonB-dependent receptor plug domain-containing protein [Spongiivirga citrea]
MHLFRLFLFLFCCVASAQTATVRGLVLNEENAPLANVNISFESGGETTNENGFYTFKIPSNKDIVVRFTHIGQKDVETIINLKTGEEIELNIVMLTKVEQISEVVITAKTRDNISGITTISPKEIRKIPGANPGVENILKSLPGVNSNNELSTQFSVRGGNYDENLVYVNEIEVYRPFLIRSGQQEGLSFVNSDLVQNVNFSAGGFQSKYGDKLSSVLDITYQVPVDFSARINASLLGGSAAIQTVSPNNRFAAIAGIRYRDNSLLVNSTQTESNFKPAFADFQGYFTYKFTNKFHLNFLGNISINDYNYEPLTRRVNFGTINEPIAVRVNYQGNEQDRYQTAFGAIKANYFLNDEITLKLISSVYHTTEQEYFDIFARYSVGQPNTDIGSEDFGDITGAEAIGSQLNHARNDLDALIINTEHKGSWEKGKNRLDWGVKHTLEDIRDNVIEWEVIDSAGFSIRPPLPGFGNDEPYTPFTGPLEPFQNVQARNNVRTNRFSAYTQFSRQTTLGKNDLWWNVGVRTHFWNISGDGIESTSQQVVSPRGQIAIKPNWEKDMLFRFAAGVYHQPPFYRELRDSLGAVQPDVKAQQSIHLVLGNDYSFKIWDRNFKLTSEAYYKHLTDVNPYTLENVRIRYRARNNAEAFAYGLDLRLNGEFVPGTESWVSFGYLKTEENIDDRGFISRPTDQRLKFAVLFQDYVPRLPDLKMYLNMVYNTGLPGGSPSYADPYLFQNRLRDYKRADLGVSYVLADANKQFNKGHWLHAFKELNVGFEIFNIFDVTNSITNTWVRNSFTRQQFAIPNFMTQRVFNVKIGMQF